MSKYDVLLENVKLSNGVVLNNRFAMAPMIVFDADDDGRVTEEGIEFMKRRAKVGGLLIAGAIAVNSIGHGEKGQLALYDDSLVEDKRAYIEAMKSGGNKVVVQLHHAGREASYGYEKHGKVMGPSAVDFEFLDRPVTEMTEAEIEGVIKDFGAATRRAIEAGYDGVEVHGANHYLLQQFFSEFSNRREDKWGGSLENRMRFPLSVLKEVKRVAKEHGDDSFIVGYRISPEEVHGENVGYIIDDALKLVEKVVNEGVDYFHVSTFGDESYKSYASKGNKDKPMNTLIKEQINGRCPLIVVGSMKSADVALDALQYGDILGMGSIALAEPDFAEKIKAGKPETINLDVEGRQEDLKLPVRLAQAYASGLLPLPPVHGIETFKFD